MLREVEDQERERYDLPCNFMLIHFGPADTDAALQWLEHALEERASALWHASLEPRFDVIRDDPRFGELVTRHGLEA